MNSIWAKDYTLENLKENLNVSEEEGSILKAIGIEITEIGHDFLKAKMPVDAGTKQIHGILHGGATCVLAETVGSIASLMVVDPETKYAMGSFISANHLRPASEGFVIATAKPVHLGRSKHVWDIPVHSDKGKLIAKCELTCAVVDR